MTTQTQEALKLAREVTDAMVDAYLTAQRQTVEEADRFGRPNFGGLHTDTVREACRNGIRAAIEQAEQTGLEAVKPREERAELIEKINKQLGDEFDPTDCFYEEELLYKAAAMLNAAPTQPQEQVKEVEPVAYMCSSRDLLLGGYQKFSDTRSEYWDIPVYTHPAKEESREWVGLTDKELDDLWALNHDRFGQPKTSSQNGWAYERAIEAKLKAKNAAQPKEKP